MELSQPDNLRLNVLLAQHPQAIRINESRMTVHALTGDTEISLQLHPNCRDEIYLRRVRELLSSHILGSPEGYPVYIRRWTRMGQARSQESLAQLLLLAEPEAVAAVVHAPDLDPELARRAWWAAPDAEHARRMLGQANIAASPVGRELADFVLEFLPFETDALTIAESVRLLLQSGRLDAAARLALWRKGRNKSVYYLGFIAACADDLPEAPPARADAAHLTALLADLPDNPVAALVRRLVSPAGQNFLLSAEHVLRKAQNQDIIQAWLNLTRTYFQSLCLTQNAALALPELQEQARLSLTNPSPALAEVLAKAPELASQLQSMQVLAGLSEAIVEPIFARSDAVGSLMRHKLEPLTTPLLEYLHHLRQPLA
jgi:hypothetical protein